MKTPSGLLGTALLFWGSQTGYMVHGVIMAIILEGARLIRQRLELGPKDFYRIIKLCALIIMGMTLYHFSTGSASMVRWLPMAIFPLLAAQGYSTVQGVDPGGIFFVIRQKEKRQTNFQPRIVNVSYHAFILILVATSAANVRTVAFYFGMVTLFCWALWPLRSKHYSILVWALLMTAVVGMGWYAQIGLQRLQRVVEGVTTNLLLKENTHSDPFCVTTSIGKIGRLKLDDHIVMRVIPETAFTPNQLFRQATYSSYRAGRWFAMNSSFSPIQKDNLSGSWQLGSRTDVPYHAWIFIKLPQGKGVLPLPSGVSKIEGLQDILMSRNRLGVIRVDGPSDIFHYRVSWNGQDTLGEPPDAIDLKIPRENRAVITKIALQLDLNNMSPRQALQALEAYFHGFRYSLVQNKRAIDSELLETFLTDTKAGHCEYFATTSALLLRAAGIPARYATGYLVTEYSRLGNCFVVRSRHAHAWTLAYIDGIWQIVDNTPSIWVDQEAQGTSVFRQLMDVASYLKYRFELWRNSKSIADIRSWVILITVILIPLLVWRLIRIKGALLKKPKKVSPKGVLSYERAESPFDRLEKHALEKLGFERYPWEPYSHWVSRFEEAGVASEVVTSLKSMLVLHYRHCFHPSGLTFSEKMELKTKVDAWIARVPRRSDLIPESSMKINENF